VVGKGKTISVTKGEHRERGVWGTISVGAFYRCPRKRKRLCDARLHADRRREGTGGGKRKLGRKRVLIQEKDEEGKSREGDTFETGERDRSCRGKEKRNCARRGTAPTSWTGEEEWREGSKGRKVTVQNLSQPEKREIRTPLNASPPPLGAKKKNPKLLEGGGETAEGLAKFWRSKEKRRKSSNILKWVTGA